MFELFAAFLCAASFVIGCKVGERKKLAENVESVDKVKDYESDFASEVGTQYQVVCDLKYPIGNLNIGHQMVYITNAAALAAWRNVHDNVPDSHPFKLVYVINEWNGEKYVPITMRVKNV